MSVVYSEFLDIKYYFKLNNIQALNIDIFDITESDKKLIKALIEINRILIDLNQHPNWIDTKIKKAPFLGLSPRQLMEQKGRSGLYEVRLYLNQHKYNVIKLYNESNRREA